MQFKLADATLVVLGNGNHRIMTHLPSISLEPEKGWSFSGDKCKCSCGGNLHLHEAGHLCEDFWEMYICDLCGGEFDYWEMARINEA